MVFWKPPPNKYADSRNACVHRAVDPGHAPDPSSANVIGVQGGYSVVLIHGQLLVIFAQRGRGSIKPEQACPPGETKASGLDDKNLGGFVFNHPDLFPFVNKAGQCGGIVNIVIYLHLAAGP